MVTHRKRRCSVLRGIDGNTHTLEARHLVFNLFKHLRSISRDSLPFVCIAFVSASCYFPHVINIQFTCNVWLVLFILRTVIHAAATTTTTTTTTISISTTITTTATTTTFLPLPLLLQLQLLLPQPLLLYLPDHHHHYHYCKHR